MSDISKQPCEGFLRIQHIVGDLTAEPPIQPLIPVSRSTWWRGVKEGRYPQPVRTLGKRLVAWRVEDIRALIESSYCTND
jgi:prophage regulatory protein